MKLTAMWCNTPSLKALSRPLRPRSQAIQILDDYKRQHLVESAETLRVFEPAQVPQSGSAA